MTKKQQRKNNERVGFPDISDSQAVLLSSLFLCCFFFSFMTVYFNYFKNSRILIAFSEDLWQDYSATIIEVESVTKQLSHSRLLDVK